MINQLGPDTTRMNNAIADDCNREAVADENLKYSRAAAEANAYSSFVRQAASRLFSTDPEGILASDAVKCAEELADELEEQGYFRIYSCGDVDLLD
jgi:hypothetical protein